MIHSMSALRTTLLIALAFVALLLVSMLLTGLLEGCATQSQQTMLPPTPRSNAPDAPYAAKPPSKPASCAEPSVEMTPGSISAGCGNPLFSLGRSSCCLRFEDAPVTDPHVGS